MSTRVVKPTATGRTARARVYAWADRHTSSSDGDEDSDTEVAEPAVEKKRWARRFSK